MAKTEEKKQINQEALILANKTFPQYKEFIAYELYYSKFGPSLKTIQDYQKSWRDIIDYTSECEDFLKFKTRIFLHMLPNDNTLYSHPRFLRILMRQVCNYISRYIARKDTNLDRTNVAYDLYKELHNENHFIQHKQDVFCAKHNDEQKQLQETKNRQRQRIKTANAQPVHMSQNEEIKLNSKSVNARLREKRKELGKQPVPFSEEQEKIFQQKKSEYRARTLQERAQITILVSINGIDR